MLFNSVEFLFYFLPVTLFAFFIVADRFGKESAIAVLVVASLFFYAWWNPKYLLLLAGSMLFNYFLGRALGRQGRPLSLLVLGIVVNLSLLGYFKYAGFLVSNINSLTGGDWNIGHVFLPLAISFFTFQQIAYLVDSYKGITQEYSFLHYCLFVSFFPQLIAGPIVHHKEMLPQFASGSAYRFNAGNFSIGLSIFAIGLFKKTVLADGVAVYANPVFAAADAGESLDFFTAWGGALAYSFQLYFDFSGYSDMAIGLARMFGIILPLNFYSPYKAANIAEFWRRWHITLSRFLRDYIYIPLGGNRRGEFRRYQNLFITMLLGGLWHGAGWNFVIWGALHGGYLAIHQIWTRALALLGFSPQNNKLYVFWSWTLTMLAVVVGWVFFRAVTLDGALGMLSSMAGANGVSIPNALYSRLDMLHPVFDLFGVQANSQGGGQFVATWLWIVALLPVCILMPNVQDLFSKVKGSLDSHFVFSSLSAFWPGLKLVRGLTWQASSRWAWLCAAALALGVMTLGQVSEFLYFQF